MREAWVRFCKVVGSTPATAGATPHKARVATGLLLNMDLTKGMNMNKDGELSTAMQALAVACIEYSGPFNDPRIGWTGAGASHIDLFKCERCGAESFDCTAIAHVDGCSAKHLLDALAAVADKTSKELT